MQRTPYERTLVANEVNIKGICCNKIKTIFNWPNKVRIRAIKNPLRIKDIINHQRDNIKVNPSFQSSRTTITIAPDKVKILKLAVKAIRLNIIKTQIDIISQPNNIIG